MSTVLDNAILVGKETTYGTAVTLTRGYEAKSDTWVRKQIGRASCRERV